ncbi:MAG: tetratricopeptide repeat protein [Bacteroidota bacterium]
MTRPHFYGRLFLLAGLFLAAVPAYAQEPDSLAGLSPLERTRALLIAGESVAAQEAAQVAAEDLGLSASGEVQQGGLATSEDIRTALILRALANESVGDYAEALADYEAFLSIENEGERAGAVRVRMSFVENGAARDRVLAFLDDDAASLARFYEPGESGIAVLPFESQSDIGLMVQFAYAITGFLRTSMGVLDHFADRDFSVSPPSDIVTLVNAVPINRIYSPVNGFTVRQAGYVMDASLVISGTVSETVGSLIVRPKLMLTDQDTTIALSPIESSLSSYSTAGTERLQQQLALRLVDEIQRHAPFDFVPNRVAFLDSLNNLIVSDINDFLAYGTGVQRLIEGNYSEADRVLGALDLPIARIERLGVRGALRASRAPLETVAEVAQLGAGEAVAVVVPPPDDPDDAGEDDPVTRDDDPGEDTPEEDTREPVVKEIVPMSPSAISLLHSMGLGALGSLGISDVDTGAQPREDGTNDPRDGKPGTLDPTRNASSVTLRIIAPLPSTTGGGQ